MPGFTTHYLLGVKTYQELPHSKIKYLISKYRGLYQLGLQGPDIFFYNIPILRHRDYRNVGSHMHEHSINEFFYYYLKKITTLKSEIHKKQALAYFCGYLCHYIGDYICHPYIYSRIGYDAIHPSNYTHGKHAELENDIDAILLKKYKGKKPSEFNQNATICLNPQEIQFISEFLADVINDTYYQITFKNSFQVSPHNVRFSIMSIRYGCRTLADPKGSKKSKIEFFENIFLKEPIVSKKLVTDIIADRDFSLNLNHEEWINPWNQSISSTESFPELFYKSIRQGAECFELINIYLNNPERFSEKHSYILLEKLGSYSYHSGLPVID